MTLTNEEKEELRALVHLTTNETINETFRVLGINTSDFEHVKEFRENHAWTSKYRQIAERVGSHVIIVFTTILTGGLVAAIWPYMTRR